MQRWASEFIFCPSKTQQDDMKEKLSKSISLKHKKNGKDSAVKRFQYISKKMDNWGLVLTDMPYQGRARGLG